MRRVIPLNDDRWRVGAVPQKPFGDVNDLAAVSVWFPARVPGDVRLDLLRAGKISDPFYGLNNETSQWVDARDWWYVRQVALGAEGARRHWLVFEGIDYQSAVFWNGAQLGRHIGMFARQAYEIPRALQTPRGELAVRVWGSEALPRYRPTPTEKIIQALGPYLRIGAPFPERLATLKCQMGYGWDFAPRLRTCGIWDDAWLVQTGAVFIRDVWIQAVPDGRVNVKLELDAARALEARASATVRGENFASEPQAFEFALSLSPRTSNYQIKFRLDAPRLWNPWDRGEPNLYQLELTLADENGGLDAATTTFGIRALELAENHDAPLTLGHGAVATRGQAQAAPPWTFVVNAAPEFIRGANWVPADALPARVTRDDYAALLELARGANVNMLRVWGGGLREKRAFYDLCDELGILVWQDFPFSGGAFDRFPRARGYLALVQAECGAIVRQLRNHPSLALWCGGNEFRLRANAHLVTTLRATVAANDGTRHFKPASPSPGERHNWLVWHGQAHTRAYRKENAAFCGEFGLQAPPSPAALAQFIPQAELFPPGKLWEYHHAELEKLWRYARAVNPQANSLETFVEAAQTAQWRGLQVMIEHARRHKPRVSGCMFWQLNEPWPAICWSVIAYARALKPAYFKIKELYNPILVSFDYPLSPRAAGDVARGELWLINDTLRAARGELTATLNGAHVLSLPVEVGANAVAALGAHAVTLGAGANALRFEFSVNGQLISTNEYDLNYCDVGAVKRLEVLKLTANAWL